MIQFISNNVFFYYSSGGLVLSKIEDSKCIELNTLNIKNLNISNISIIDLNNNFYCLNDGNIILLLNKTNLDIAKTIKIDYQNIGLSKISDNFISVFILIDKKIVLENYDVSMGGIKWSLKESKNFLEGYNIACTQSNNFIFFIKKKNNSYNYFNNNAFQNTLFEIKIKKGV